MTASASISVESFLTIVAANFEHSTSRPPAVTMLLKKINTYKQIGLEEADIANRIKPKPKFDPSERLQAIDRYVERLEEAGLNSDKFSSVLRDLKVDSFEGLLRAGELRAILGHYVGSSKMSSKDDGIARLQKRFEDRLAA